MSSYKAATHMVLVSGSAGDIKTATTPGNVTAFYLSVASDSVYMTLAGGVPGPSAGHIVQLDGPVQFFPVNQQTANNPAFASVTAGARIAITFLF
jgi:hypothetical protein